MKVILTILSAVFAASCSPDIPEGTAGSRSGEKQEGITVTVDTATTEYEYEFELKCKGYGTAY